MANSVISDGLSTPPKVVLDGSDARREFELNAVMVSSTDAGVDRFGGTAGQGRGDMVDGL